MVVVGGGPGGRGLRRAARRRRARGGARGAAAGGRRVLLLRVHAVEGAAAPGRAARRGAAHPGRARGGDRRPRRAARCSSGATRSSTTSTTPDMEPWLDDHGIDARARARAASTASAGSTVRRRRCWSRARRWWWPPAAARPSRRSTGCARREPWTNREVTTAKEVPERAGDPRRRRGGRGDGAGVEHARVRRSRSSRRATACCRARGAVRRRAGALRPCTSAAWTCSVGVEGHGGAGERRRGGARARRRRPGPRRRAARGVGRRPRTDDLGLETRRARAGQADRGRRPACARTTGSTPSAT